MNGILLGEHACCDKNPETEKVKLQKFELRRFTMKPRTYDENFGRLDSWRDALFEADTICATNIEVSKL